MPGSWREPPVSPPSWAATTAACHRGSTGADQPQHRALPTLFANGVERTDTGRPLESSTRNGCRASAISAWVDGPLVQSVERLPPPAGDALTGQRPATPLPCVRGGCGACRRRPPGQPWPACHQTPPRRTSAIRSARAWDSVMITQPSPTAGPLPPSGSARTGPTNCSPPTSGASTSSGAARLGRPEAGAAMLLGALFQRAFFSAFSGELIPAAGAPASRASMVTCLLPGRACPHCRSVPAGRGCRHNAGLAPSVGWLRPWAKLLIHRHGIYAVRLSTDRSDNRSGYPAVPLACPAVPLTRPYGAPLVPLPCPTRTHQSMGTRTSWGFSPPRPAPAR